MISQLHSQQKSHKRNSDILRNRCYSKGNLFKDSLRTTQETYIYKANAKRGKTRKASVNPQNMKFGKHILAIGDNADTLAKCRENKSQSKIKYIIKQKVQTNDKKTIAPRSKEYLKPKQPFRLKGQRLREKYKKKMADYIHNDQEEKKGFRNLINNSADSRTQNSQSCISKLKETEAISTINGKALTINSKPTKASKKKFLKYMTYFINSCDDLSKEIEVDMPEMQDSINKLKVMTRKEDLNMKRLLNDADSSMIQLFSKRIEEMEGPLSEGEMYQQLQDFK